MKYRILNLLQEGNTGPVHLIIDHDGQQRIRKRYHKKTSGVSEGLLNEIMIMNNSRHPNLISINRIIFNPTCIDLILDKIDTNFHSIIKDGINKQRLRLYLQQMTQGLFQIHLMGFIHNDIKPQNIMYDRSNKLVKIIDFGLAFQINFPYTRITNIKTTHHFTPPEYFDYRESGQISFNSDIFSLGVVFYYMINPDLYREMLMDPKDLVFNPQTIDWINIRNQIGDEGRDLLEQMLDFDPSKRINSEQILKHPYFESIVYDNKSVPKSKSSMISRGKSGRRSGVRDDYKQPGKKGSPPHRGSPPQTGSSRSSSSSLDFRRFEFPSLATKSEFLHPNNNHLYFLQKIVEQSNQNTSLIKIPKYYDDKLTKCNKKRKQSINIPSEIINDLYLIFLRSNMKIITLCYAMILIINYFEHCDDGIINYQDLVTILIISGKINEISRDFMDKIEIDFDLYSSEIKVLSKLDLSIPWWETKEIILYHDYLSYFYQIDPYNKLSKINHYYHFFVISMLSSLIYFDPILIKKSKSHLVELLLWIAFRDFEPSDQIKESHQQLLAMIRKNNIVWINQEIYYLIR